MTMGPWKPISLQTYSARIADLRVQTEVSESLNVSIKVSMECTVPTGKAEFVLRDPTGKVVHEADIILSSTQTIAEFGGSKANYQLWYPIGYGKQPIYTLVARLSDAVG